MPFIPPITDIKTALAKAAKYCAYQERCEQELRNKLRDWHVDESLYQEVLDYIVAEGFINEERFAVAYAGGKHRIKLWGKYKIRHALQAKGVSDSVVRKALESIDLKEYRSNLLRLVERYMCKVDTADAVGRQKLIQYLKNKGYEIELIFEVIR